MQAYNDHMFLSTIQHTVLCTVVSRHVNTHALEIVCQLHQKLLTITAIIIKRSQLHLLQKVMTAPVTELMHGIMQLSWQFASARYRSQSWQLRSLKGSVSVRHTCIVSGPACAVSLQQGCLQPSSVAYRIESGS
jgi:hypothetical protein